jgi:hypothetical protein
MSIERLSGGLTPADGADPRTFPAIWNATADDLEAGDYSRVPTGGSAGQVLVKDSATNYDAVWQKSLGLGSQRATTYTSNNMRWTQNTFNNPTAQSFSAGGFLARMFGLPLRVEEPTKYDRIACEITVASVTATDQARMGIYKVNTDGASNAHDLVLDAGLVNVDTTGVKEITIDLTLQRGIYILVWVRQNTATSAITTRSLGNSDPFVGVNNFADTAVGYVSGSTNTVAGALPTTTSGDQLHFGNAFCPMIRLRKADL